MKKSKDRYVIIVGEEFLSHYKFNIFKEIVITSKVDYKEFKNYKKCLKIAIKVAKFDKETPVKIMRSNNGKN